jgi:hypothetical protein
MLRCAGLTAGSPDEWESKGKVIKPEVSNGIHQSKITKSDMDIIHQIH